MSSILNESATWQTVDHNPQEAIRYLETLTGLLDSMKRLSIDMLRLRPGGYEDNYRYGTNGGTGETSYLYRTKG